MSNHYLFHQWAQRHGITPQALQELQQLIVMDHLPPPKKGISESAVQSGVRIEAAENNVWLTRNNVGVLKDNRGVPVRYGLCNSSQQENEVCKSSDLIGIRTILITPEMVGSSIGQFVARETKRADWKWKGDKHEQAQLAFLHKVIAMGGDGAFCNGVGSL